MKILIGFLITLTFFSCINDKGVVNALPEISETKTDYDLDKSMNIFIDRSNHLFVDTIAVDIDELKIRVHEYVSETKSSSVISLKSAPESSYGTYIDVQNAVVGEIRFLREQLSKETYHIELDRLTKAQLSEIRKVYPLNLVE